MLLTAMQTFPRSICIQTKCCWALLTLAGSDEMCQNIAQRGGIGAVLAAMLNCPDDADVQHYGSWALLNLVMTTHGSKNAPLHEFARQEGVVEVVEAAMACFPEHEGIQDKCQSILERMRTSQ